MTQKTQNPKAPAALEQVIAALLEAGFIPDGQTAQETVRIPTTETPVFGGAGGTLTTLGGRQRFSLPGTNIKVTAGKITTYFYKIDGTLKPIAHLQTKDLEAVQNQIQILLINS